MIRRCASVSNGLRPRCCLAGVPHGILSTGRHLAKDMHWYENNIMGSGPFIFVEHIRGSHLVGKRNPDYWERGKPIWMATAPSSSAIPGRG